MSPEREKFVLVTSSKTFLNTVLWCLLPVYLTCMREAKIKKRTECHKRWNKSENRVLKKQKRKKKETSNGERESDLAVCFTLFIPYLLSTWSWKCSRYGNTDKVAMYSTASWDVTPCSLVRGHRCFREIATFIFRVADYAGQINPVQDIEKVWMGLGDSELTTDGGSNTQESYKWTGRVIRQ